VAKAIRNYVNTPVPQTKKASNLQVANNAGGFAFAVSDETRLTRFLILGTDGGTYYVKEGDFTEESILFVKDLIRRNEDLVRNTAVAISEAGRAYRNDAAIFVMALLLSEGKNKSATVAAIPSVVRIGSHVYSLAGYITALGGWGRSKRAAIANWFTSQTPDNLAYQAVKYRQRDGWTMRDLMRKSHPSGVDKNVGNFILGKGISGVENSSILVGFDGMQKVTTVPGVLRVLDNYPNLPWETIPTQYLTDLKVWKKLYENGQLRGQALLRNITRLAKMGAFEDLNFAREIANALTNEEMIRKTRLHPMQYLNAYVVYVQGQISRSAFSYGDVGRNKTWNTSGIITDALDDGFGISFGNIEPSNKRMMISVDVSGSMSWTAAGTSNFTCAQAAGAMALVTARVEPLYEVNGFSDGLTDLRLSARDSIESAFQKVQRNNFGRTDCAAPVIHASRSGIQVDTFVIITDNETYAGSIHPHKALEKYRKETGINARMVVMGMAANNFSIANPLDAGMLDVVGFDSNTPKVVSDFSAGRL
jgi:60 kDa SS-A/Ro ribonucleoprotein